ncbi:MAG TPA: ferredoxin, partial [candidate division Zixibacteria bacterium]|nr:ferredoxin [candidate division Zixibacteria bacterium]
ARRSRPLAQLALGLNEVFVLQCTSSHLFQMRNELNRGLAFEETALFHVFSGATKTTGGLPAYLVAAAATESRAFPAFVYDPCAGADRTSRSRLEANPQPEFDWPVQKLALEDEEHQKITEEPTFTLADFVALDSRFAAHFARVPREEWNEDLITVDRCLNGSDAGMLEKLPALLMVDGENRLQRVLVDEKLLRETRRCLDTWKNLQEMARPYAVLVGTPSEPGKEISIEPVPSVKPVQIEAPKGAVPVDAEPAIASDDPYIETPRCTTCNECTNINNKMFAYNENKQAYIANPDAGTYAQLVEAAESCQVAIIHPGKPRNPSEPGLEEMMGRAESFR